MKNPIFLISAWTKLLNFSWLVLLLVTAACQNDAVTEKTLEEVITKTPGSPAINTYSKDFGYITAIAVDEDGNLYVADGAKNEILKINGADQSVVRVAGIYSADPNFSYDGDGGAATTAHMQIPIGLDITANGDIYIADVGNNVIRKVTASTGFISTISGKETGYSGDNGLATNATFFAPQDVAVDSYGNVYIADTENHAIRKISSTTGIVTTIAGLGPDAAGYSGDGGPAISAALNFPTGLAIDANSNIFVVEHSNSVVRKIDATTGIITTVCGVAKVFSYFGDGGPAKLATLSYPNKLSFDPDGNLLVADSNNSVIRKITMATGIITTIAGSGKPAYSGDSGDATAATLNNPASVSADKKGNIYIADQYNGVIRVVK
ncbi:MAG: hypothetical protein ABI477_08070 [Chryseolinea sp.]